MARKKQQKDDSELSVIEKLEAKYGVGSTTTQSSVIISTGSMQLDRAMKIGGTTLGKIIEIWGPNSSGKSTLMLHQIAEYQKAFPDKLVALFDYEYSYDARYAKAIGVDVDTLKHYCPDTQEAGYNMILDLIATNLFSCIVIDSQTAAPPKAVLEGEMGDSTIALQARNNSKFCLKVKGLLSIHNVTLFVVSQTRNSIGGISNDPTVTTGGEAFKFYSDVRWKVWKMNDKDNELSKTTVDVVKSKIGKPFGQAKFSILWGLGISRMDEIIDYADDLKIIKKSGTWYSYEGTTIGQGNKGVKETFNDNPELYEEITEKVKNKLDNKINLEPSNELD